MRLEDITIGMLVHADDCAPEDADQGYVTAINYETGMVEVGWDSCQRSEQLADGLEPGPLPTADAPADRRVRDWDPDDDEPSEADREVIGQFGRLTQPIEPDSERTQRADHELDQAKDRRVRGES